jgi:hypothetical protein
LSSAYRYAFIIPSLGSASVPSRSSSTFPRLEKRIWPPLGRAGVASRLLGLLSLPISRANTRRLPFNGMEWVAQLGVPCQDQRARRRVPMSSGSRPELGRLAEIFLGGRRASIGVASRFIEGSTDQRRATSFGVFFAVARDVPHNTCPVGGSADKLTPVDSLANSATPESQCTIGLRTNRAQRKKD